MNNISLYSAAEEVRTLLEQIDPETGELPDGFEAATNLVKTKAAATAAFILSNDAEAEMVENIAKSMLARVKAAKKRSDWLRYYLALHMKNLGITEIKALDGTFKAVLQLERDESVHIFDEKQIPDFFMREKLTYEPDKTLIHKSIQEGAEVPGAWIQRKDRLTIK
jgi:Siphovirus Gp157